MYSYESEERVGEIGCAAWFIGMPILIFGAAWYGHHQGQIEQAHQHKVHMQEQRHEEREAQRSQNRLIEREVKSRVVKERTSALTSGESTPQPQEKSVQYQKESNIQGIVVYNGEPAAVIGNKVFPLIRGGMSA